jgi:hypothetical protein
MKRIHWKRVIAAAILSEVGVFVALFAAFGVYSLVTQTTFDTIYNSRGEDIAYYVAPPTAFGHDGARGPVGDPDVTSGLVRHGVLVGLVAVLLTFFFILSARRSIASCTSSPSLCEIAAALWEAHRAQVPPHADASPARAA